MKSVRRALAHSQASQPVRDGVGVKIRRNVPDRPRQTFDPFLMLDEFASDNADDYIGGFPEHPHRGFETVTYMLEGKMEHKDHLGNQGLLQSGGVQWMTAGRGVLHSEMPLQESGRMHGFQLWVNLPAKEKMSAPNCREFEPEEIPEVVISNHSSAKVIAGTFDLNGVKTDGVVKDVTTKPDYFDIHLGDAEVIDLNLDASKRVLLYVYEGDVAVISDQGEDSLNSQQLGLLSDGDSLRVRAESNSRFLLLAGKPINEPVVNYGPFVMNTREEIEQAIHDFQTGRLVDA